MQGTLGVPPTFCSQVPGAAPAGACWQSRLRRPLVPAAAAPFLGVPEGTLATPLMGACLLLSTPASLHPGGPKQKGPWATWSAHHRWPTLPVGSCVSTQNPRGLAPDTSATAGTPWFSDWPLHTAPSACPLLPGVSSHQRCPLSPVLFTPPSVPPHEYNRHQQGEQPPQGRADGEAPISPGMHTRSGPNSRADSPSPPWGRRGRCPQVLREVQTHAAWRNLTRGGKIDLQPHMN